MDQRDAMLLLLEPTWLNRPAIQFDGASSGVCTPARIFIIVLAGTVLSHQDKTSP